MDMVLPWGRGPWTQPAFEAIRRALHSKSQLIRIGAIRTIRAWVYNFPQPIRSWSKREIDGLRSLLREPAFRQEVLLGARRMAQSSADQSGPMLQEGPGKGYFINLAPYDAALALSGDSRALPYFLGRLKGRSSGESFDYIASMGYLPLAKIRAPLDGFVARVYARKTQDQSTANDLYSMGAFQQVVIALARAEEGNFDRYLATLTDRKLDSRYRASMMRALAYFGDEQTERAIVKAFGQSGNPEYFGLECISALRELPNNLGRRDVEAISRGPNKLLANHAKMILRIWDSLEPQRALSAWGFGPPIENRY